MKKRNLTAGVLFTCLSCNVSASLDDEEFDPRDLTRVYTQGAILMTSDADLRFMGSMTGAYNKSTQFATFLEGNFGNNQGKKEDQNKFGLDYQKSRFQYFQVHTLDNNPLFPRLGLSADVMHFNNNAGKLNGSGVDDTLLLAIGAVGLINPAWTGELMLFPNIAYMTGEAFGKEANGPAANLFMTYPLGSGGGFFQGSYEYFDVEGDIVSLSSSMLTASFSLPLSESKSSWFITKAYYGNTESTMPDNIKNKVENDMKIEMGMRWYF